MEENEIEEECEECHGRGIVKEADGTNHTCWKCLSNGKLSQHSKNLKDHDIKI